MACNCGGGKKAGRLTYVVTKPDGTSMSFSSEIEAKAAVRRNPGSVIKPTS